MEFMFWLLSLSLWAGYLKNSCGWIRTKLGGQVGCVTRKDCFDFWWRSGSGSENLKDIFKWFFPIERWDYRWWYVAWYFKKIVDGFGRISVDELGRWQEQADSILFKMWTQIRLISGIHTVTWTVRLGGGMCSTECRSSSWSNMGIAKKKRSS